MKKHESKTAWSTAHAWAIVDELFPGDYARDDHSSERAGYPIYRATSEDSREALADKEAECDDLAQSVENALQHAEDMEAEAQKLAAEVMRLKARLFDLMEAQQGRIA
nr:MAG TPA: tail fiber assembly helper protein [Caudoviricetes sp.]DAG32347.1 MAG TPA: tail fiber assembly helper protein [Caudoviricetes sp.]